MRVAVFGNIYKHGFFGSFNELLQVLDKQHVDVLLCEDLYDAILEKKQVLPSKYTVIKKSDTNFDADLAFSVGGDGTFLKTAEAIADRNIPIMGINIGRLGFLADVSIECITATVTEILEQGYKIEERSVLKLVTDNHSLKTNNKALNEIAVLKLDSSSMIMIHATVNNEYLCSYQADGLLIPTPTGSTAYALSVGASIMTPQNRSFIIAPIAPHSLNLRPLIIPDDWEIELEIESRNNSFLISLDGRSEVLDSKTRLHISKAGYTVKVAKRNNYTYFQTLRNKLMWGADKRNLNN